MRQPRALLAAADHRSNNSSGGLHSRWSFRHWSWRTPDESSFAGALVDDECCWRWGVMLIISSPVAIKNTLFSAAEPLYYIAVLLRTDRREGAVIVFNMLLLLLVLQFSFEWLMLLLLLLAGELMRGFSRADDDDAELTSRRRGYRYFYCCCHDGDFCWFPAWTTPTPRQATAWRWKALGGRSSHPSKWPMPIPDPMPMPNADAAQMSLLSLLLVRLEWGVWRHEVDKNKNIFG